MTAMKNGIGKTAWAATVCFALILVGCASGPLPSGTVSENVVSMTAKVLKINQETREVTLQRSDNSVVKVAVGEDVRNLPQVNVGDVVTVTYYESVAYDVKRADQGAPGVAVAAQSERAELGEKPGGGMGRAVRVTTTIAAIDKDAMTVTLRNPDGETTTVRVRDPKKLDQVAVGDLVEITYTQAVAISVKAP